MIDYRANRVNAVLRAPHGRFPRIGRVASRVPRKEKVCSRVLVDRRLRVATRPLRPGNTRAETPSGTGKTTIGRGAYYFREQHYISGFRRDVEAEPGAGGGGATSSSFDVGPGPTGRSIDRPPGGRGAARTHANGRRWPGAPLLANVARTSTRRRRRVFTPSETSASRRVSPCDYYYYYCGRRRR